MKEERKVAVVLQARLNSQRVPKKMIRSFSGKKSLFEIALEKLIDSEIPSKDIFIAVGDIALIDIAVQYPFNLYTRSQESCNATNDPNVPDSLKLLYEWYNDLQDKGYTHVVLVSACHPFLKPETIEDFYKEFSNSTLDGMFSVLEKKNYYWDYSGETITDWKGAKLMNTRRVEPIYEAAHCLYGSKISFIEDECWMGDTSPPEPELYIVNESEAIDIDTIEDFIKAKILYNEGFAYKLIEEEHVSQLYEDFDQIITDDLNRMSEKFKDA